jgi:hypothetical protein
MEPSDSPLLEPIEYEEQLERAKQIEDPLTRDRTTASDPQYDCVIHKLQTLERESGERLTRTRG